MTWVKLDDAFPQHPKIIGLSDAAFRLHVEAIAYSNRYLTDGRIPPAVAGQRGEAAWKELLEVGIWEQPVAPGALIHDYHDFQPSRAEVEAEREWRRRAGRAGGRASAQARARASAQANGQGHPQADAQAFSNPVPVASSSTKKKRANTRSKAEVKPDPQPPKYEGRCEECALFLPDHAESCSHALPEASAAGAGDGLAMLEAF